MAERWRKSILQSALHVWPILGCLGMSVLPGIGRCGSHLALEPLEQRALLSVGAAEPYPENSVAAGSIQEEVEVSFNVATSEAAVDSRPPCDCENIWQTPTHGQWYEDNPTYIDYYDDTHDWTFSTPEDQGMDSELIEEGIAELRSEDDIFSALIVKNGVIVHEEYFNGSAVTHSNNVHSASKSMLSAMVGIAIAEGYIESLDQKISEIMPEYFTKYSQNDVRRDITVRHLLTMTAGLSWVEDSTEYRMDEQDNWVQKILDRGLNNEPGSQFLYSTGIAHLTSAVITRATGMSTCEFAHSRLFEPLNINADHWGRDPQGIFSGGYNTYFTPREMARFGLLYLNRGSLNGDPIVPEWFVDESLSSIHNKVSVDGTHDYGYFWWSRRLSGYDAHLAWGWGGQYIYVVPQLDLMFISTAGTAGNAGYNEIDAGVFLRDFLIPSINDLPESPVLFYDSFENGEWDGLWVEDSQYDWFDSSQRSTDGEYSAQVDGRATDATLTMAQPIDTTGYGSVDVSFDWYIERDFDRGEYLAIDFTADGTNWNEIVRLSGNVNEENTWHDETIEVDPSYLTDQFRIRFRAYVSGSWEDANVDNVEIIGLVIGDPPVANAGGPYSVEEGGSIMLDGSSSQDPDGEVVAWAWDFDGDGYYDDATGPTPIFNATSDGEHTVGLRVTDDKGQRGTATAMVMVANLPPTADAGGPYTVDEGAAIALDGMLSTDPGNDIVSYQWDFGNDGTFDASGATANLTPDEDGFFEIMLKVTDDAGATDTALTTANVANLPPTADAGGPYFAEEGNPVQLDASASTDPGDDLLSYAWDLDGDGQFYEATGATTVLNGLTIGTYQVAVQVSDGDGGISTDEATVFVNHASVGPELQKGVIQARTDQWTTVTLDHSYNSMVVVLTPNYDKSSVPLVTRVQNASGNSFDVKLDRADGISSDAVFANAHYMVVEEGLYTVAEHGVKMEAVKYYSTTTAENGNWEGDDYVDTRNYQQSYAQPVVVGQVMSYNDPDWSVFWACGSTRNLAPSATILKVGKHVGEDPDATRSGETIGYVVFEAGVGNIDGEGFVAAVSSDTIRGVDNSPGYTQTFAELPSISAAIASSAAMDGVNGGWAVLYGSNPVTTTSIELAIDEDRMGDSERRHTTEQVAYIVFDPPAVDDLSAPLVPQVEIDPVAKALMNTKISDAALLSFMHFGEHVPHGDYGLPERSEKVNDLAIAEMWNLLPR